MKVFLRRVALYAFALWSFFPLYWLLNTSFKTSKDALARPPTFIFKPIMKNYIEVIKNNEVWGYFLDSLIVALGTTSDVQPMSNPHDMKQRLRPDLVSTSNQREPLMASAPTSKHGYFLVPKVID